MRGLSTVLALGLAATANAIVMTKEVEEAFHTDEWCAKHHLGEGPSTCIQNPGCCYDGSLGICHSCDFHSHEWCKTYGGDSAQECVKFAGCTFKFDKNASEENEMDGECQSAMTPEEAGIQDDISCTVASQVCTPETPNCGKCLGTTPVTRLWYDPPPAGQTCDDVAGEKCTRPKLQCSDEGLSEVKYPPIGSRVPPFGCNKGKPCASDPSKNECECEIPMTPEMQLECDGEDCLDTGKWKYRVAPYGYYLPQCTEEGEYEPEQATMMAPYTCRADDPMDPASPNCMDVMDAEGCDVTKTRCNGCSSTPGCSWLQNDEATRWVEEMKWCADLHGHEVPDTRKKAPQFDAERINCAKKRRQYAGEQCPNAVTLTTGNGEVFINDHEDVGNCDMLCNTDMDCFPGNETRPAEWCCFNGCGYSCQVPIKPKADCDVLGAGFLGPGMQASDLEEDDISGNNGGGKAKHGSEVTVSCKPGWNAEKDADGKRVNSVTVMCSHGKWGDFSQLKCLEDCPPYRIRGGQHRMNDDMAPEDQGMCIGGAAPSYEFSERTGTLDKTKSKPANWHDICATKISRVGCEGTQMNPEGEDSNGESANCRWVPSDKVDTLAETDASVKMWNGSKKDYDAAVAKALMWDHDNSDALRAAGRTDVVDSPWQSGSECRAKEFDGDSLHSSQMEAYEQCLPEGLQFDMACENLTDRKSCNMAGATCGDEGAPPTDPRTALCEWIPDQVGQMKEHGSPTRVKSGRNKQMRTRDYVIKGNGLEHGSKRRVSCAEGFGAVEGTKDMIAYNRQKIRCVNGAWEPQELVCSTCFDAPSVGKFAWRDERGNDCLYYSSRPMECLKSEQRTEEEKMADDTCKEILFDGQSSDPKTFECDDAKARCRIACRTCPQAQEKYRVKAIMKSIKSMNAGGVAVSGVEHPESWTRKFMKILVGHQREIKSQRRVKVAKRIKKA